jgi:3-dehydroquinate dehydratase-1
VVGVISAALTLDRLASGFRPVCDIVELRVDLLGVGATDWLVRALDLEAAGCPVLITIRHPREGGHWYGSEAERLDLFAQVLPHVSAIDFEIRSEGFAEMARRTRASGKTLIASYHDFEKLPTEVDLRAVIEQACAAEADIIKIAAVTQTEADLERLESLLAHHRGPPLCVLGMGAMGPASRTRLPLHGSCLTYGFVDEANVPGQLSSAELVEFLRRTWPG